MRNKILSIALAFVTLVGLVPLTATTAEASDDEIVEITTAGTCNYDYANEVAELVNEERAAAGLNTLVNDKRLTEWAMQRAAEQAFYFGHIRPDGTGWSTVNGGLSAYPYYLWFGENAEKGAKTPTSVMNDWMNSAGHKATLMDEGYTAVGVGCFTTSDGYTYWIQIFAGPSIGAGGDYEIIESTYSGSKVQTFIISTYKSNIGDLNIDVDDDTEDVFLDGTISVTVGQSASVYLKMGSSGGVGRPYIVPIASNIKDSSTGKVIATTAVSSTGAVTITSTATGTGYLYLYAYEGASPQSVKIIVSAGYTVTFTYNGSDIGVSSQTVAYGKTATEPEAPKKDGYVFLYWSYYKMSSKYGLTGEYDFSTPVTHDVTLTASYIVARTVTFDSNGGSSVSSQTVAHNSTATEPTAPARSGYTFAGWYTAASGGTKYDFSSAVRSDLTLYAHWTANSSGSSSSGGTTTAEETTTSASDTTTKTEETTTKSEETTKFSETTTNSSETTKSSSTTAESSKTTTKAAETTKDSVSENSTESDKETTAAEETTGVSDEDETTAADETVETPDEKTPDDAAKIETSDETDDGTDTTDAVTDETDTETTAEDSDGVTSDDENNSDSDNAVVANNSDGGDNNGSVVAGEENRSNTWIVVLVVVLLAAACAVTFAILKKKKNDDKITDIEEVSETAEGDSESESSDAENHDDGGGDNTEE